MAGITWCCVAYTNGVLTCVDLMMVKMKVMMVKMEMMMAIMKTTMAITMLKVMNSA